MRLSRITILNCRALYLFRFCSCFVSIHKRTIFMIWVKFGPHIYFDIFKIVSGTFESFLRRVDDYARYILYTLFFIHLLSLAVYGVRSSVETNKYQMILYNSYLQFHLMLYHLKISLKSLDIDVDSIIISKIFSSLIVIQEHTIVSKFNGQQS